MNFKTIKRFGRNQSVFGKLILSFGIVVALVTATLGVVFYLFFASRYNREIEKVHQKMLEQVSATIRFRVIQPVTRCFLDLFSEYSGPAATLFHFTEPIKGNNYKIVQTAGYLQQMVAEHSDVFSAIHVYYKKTNLIISSAMGIGFLAENSYKNLDWILPLTNSSDRLVWLAPRQTYFYPTRGGSEVSKANVFTFIRAFPITATGTDCQGLLAIDVNEATVSNLIRDTLPSQYQNTFIINGQGRIISHPRKNRLLRILGHESYIRQIIDSPLNYGSFTKKVNHTQSMVTFAALPNTEWKIVNIMPLARFYQSTNFIRWLLIALCLAAALFGLLISFGFTRQIYYPLGAILAKVRLLTGTVNSIPQENEYGFINRVIDEIAVKVRSLRETEPLLQNSLIMELLHHRFFSEQEMAEKVKLLDDTLRFPHYYVVLFQIDETAIKDFTLEKSLMIKDHLTLEIQKIHDEQGKCLEIDLSDWRFGVIAGVNEADSPFINRFIERIIAESLSNYQLPVTATVGNRVGSWLEINQSFQEATLLLKYHYFYPQTQLIRGEKFLKKERSREIIPDSLMAAFSDHLRRRNLPQLEQTLTQLIATITAGDYAANYCQQVVLEIAHVFSVYLKDMRYTLSENEQSGLANLLLITGNIYGFKEWICQFAERVFTWVTARTGNRNYEIVAKAVQYLAANLERDLSLDSAAELVNLSPSYFSKIFKEVTGAAFPTYLADLRIEKAQELLVKTNLTIQEIGYQVGYNTPAYFIKQFKAKSGYTPYDYRRQFQNRTFQP